MNTRRIDGMSNITKRVALALACIAVVATAYADERVRNAILASTDQPLTIKVGEHRHIKLINLIHDGDATATGGTLRVSRENGPTVTVITAVPQTAGEGQKDIFIAGPAQLTLSPVTNGTVFLAYKIGEH